VIVHFFHDWDVCRKSQEKQMVALCGSQMARWLLRYGMIVVAGWSTVLQKLRLIGIA
jgi:hypothetical protein